MKANLEIESVIPKIGKAIQLYNIRNKQLANTIIVTEEIFEKIQYESTGELILHNDNTFTLFRIELIIVDTQRPYVYEVGYTETHAV